MSDTTTTTTTAEKRNYKKTLNLPKTDFPMRANLAQNEPQSQKRWQKEKLYEQVIALRDQAGAEPFVFHDGPPYANASIHTGHLLNKVLKDFVVRSRLVMGRQCKFIPGWDCHGLPIEHQVMTQLIDSGEIEELDKLDDDQRRMEIRKRCKKYASSQIKLQMSQMQRLLTLADYDNPYLTMVPGYEEGVLEVFAELVRQGVVYRDLKAVHWSIANETALAEAELEYRDKVDISIYVDFEAVDKSAVAEVFGVELDQTPSFMIWTTTPWTLPANLAIAVNERFRYALVEIDGNVTVIATDRVETVSKAAGAESVRVLAEVDGSALLGLHYQHPFCDREGPIVAAEYVTLEDGTGLVHTAPGHGQEDYQTGIREGLKIYCPVLKDGTYDQTVPDWLKGKLIWDANAEIVEHLQRSGHLFYHHEFNHSYPHDWRSKTPVIFRATEQWFVSVDTPVSFAAAGQPAGAQSAAAADHEIESATLEGEMQPGSLRDLALHAADEQIRFYPQWGRNRMRGMLETRPDWCLSRQRAWGLPIPAFELPDGEILLSEASVRAVAKVFGQRGSDAWFTDAPAQLLEHYDMSSDPDAPEGLKSGSATIDDLSKMRDIFDVWFESGSSWHSVLRRRNLGYPADLYLEGSDQHRGWFQLSLLPALGVTGRSPFNAVLTHGFVVDKDGRKMSKSEGNVLSVEDLLKDYGADVCRWWVSSISYEGDVRADREFFDLAGDSYRKVRNTVRFLLSNLSDDQPPADLSIDQLRTDPSELPPESIDALVLHAAHRLQNTVVAAYENYEFRRAHQALYDFCNDTLSAFYCAAVKDRLYCDKPDSERRRRTQSVMWDLVQILARLLAPLMPHSADEAFCSLHGVTSGKDGNSDLSVHTQTLIRFDEPRVDPDWPKVLEVREQALKALENAKERGIENPLDAEVVLPDPEGVYQRFSSDLPDMLGVSRIKFIDHGEISVNDLRDEPRCERSWKRDGTVRQRSDGGMLTDRDAQAVGVE